MISMAPLNISDVRLIFGRLASSECVLSHGVLIFPLTELNLGAMASLIWVRIYMSICRFEGFEKGGVTSSHFGIMVRDSRSRFGISLV